MASPFKKANRTLVAIRTFLPSRFLGPVAGVFGLICFMLLSDLSAFAFSEEPKGFLGRGRDASDKILCQADGERASGTSSEEKSQKAEPGCDAHVISVSRRSGEETFSLICGGKCKDGEQCRERWFTAYDKASGGTVLTRACYCDEEIKSWSCCDPKGATGGRVLENKCRIALAYPADAQLDEQGKESKTPTKNPTGVYCISDCPGGEGAICSPRERVIEEGDLTVKLISCKCFH